MEMAGSRPLQVLPSSGSGRLSLLLLVYCCTFLPPPTKLLHCTFRLKGLTPSETTSNITFLSCILVMVVGNNADVLPMQVPYKKEGSQVPVRITQRPLHLADVSGPSLNAHQHEAQLIELSWHERSPGFHLQHHIS